MTIMMLLSLSLLILLLLLKFRMFLIRVIDKGTESILECLALKITSTLNKGEL